MNDRAHDRQPAPLAGFRVFDLTRNFAGPFATLLLADLGAEVIKIEDPRRGDEGRYMPPFDDSGVSTMFASFNRGKRSVALDLKDPADRDAARRIAASCDIFIENLRPGRTESLGLGWDDVSALNPRVIYCAISAFGRVGERGDDPGYDAIIQAYSGLMDLTGSADGPPSRVGTGLIDIGTGMFAALNILAAIRVVQQTGRGVRISSVMAETAAALMMHHLAGVRHGGARPTRTGTAQHNMAPYEGVRTKNGMLMVAAASQSLWEQLCATLGADHLVGDPRFASTEDRVANRTELVAELERYATMHTTEELELMLHKDGIPAAAIRSVDQFAVDPHLDTLGLWGSAGESDHELPLAPFRLGSWRPRIARGVPELGEHTQEVLEEIDGLSDQSERAAVRADRS